MKRTKPTTKKRYKRPGRPTKDEKEIVKAAVRQGGGDLPLDKTKALAKVFNRPVGTIKSLIAKAKDDLAADADFYVNTHRTVVEAALASGAQVVDGLTIANDKLLEVARKGSEWALENISGDGKRVVEKADNAPQGTRIMIGVRLSNTSIQPQTVIDVSADAAEGEIVNVSG